MYSTIVPGDSVKPEKRIFVSGFPVLFYTPETRFGYGAAGVCIFNFKKDSLLAPRSSVNLGLTYTQNKQILFYLPFTLFIKNREYQVYGEVTYTRYLYDFYGVGNDVPKSYVERYGIEFPRLRLTALKKLKKNFYAGPRYAYDKVSLYDLDTTAQLFKNTIPGSSGATISGFGLVTLFDNRDFIFYPSKGLLAELVIYRNDRVTGASVNYTRIALDISKYFSYKRNILALNFYGLFSDRELPFFQMGILGGQKKMRGFYEGRYRDNNAIILQAEYRTHLFWRLGLTIFGDMGQVASRVDNFNANNWRFTYGTGLRLRIDDAQKLNLRIDLGVGNNQVLPYFTIGEAF